MSKAIFSSMSRAIVDFADKQRTQWHEAKLRAFRRVKRNGNQKGFTLVELLVAMTIFAIFSSMMVVALTQFLRTSQVSMERTQSATRVANASEQITRFTQFAYDAKASTDGTTLYLLIPGYAVGYTAASSSSSAGAKDQVCAKITYNRDEGTLSWTSERIASDLAADETIPGGYTSAGAVIGRDFINAVSQPMFATQNGTVTFKPVNGRDMYGNTIQTTTEVTITARNYNRKTATGDYNHTTSVDSCVA